MHTRAGHIKNRATKSLMQSMRKGMRYWSCAVLCYCPCFAILQRVSEYGRYGTCEVLLENQPELCDFSRCKSRSFTEFHHYHYSKRCPKRFLPPPKKKPKNLSNMSVLNSDTFSNFPRPITSPQGLLQAWPAWPARKTLVSGHVELSRIHGVLKKN